MKNLKKVLLFAALSTLALTGCGSEAGGGGGSSSGGSHEHKKIASDTLYVKKVENMPDDFVIGMDSSSVLSLEESGVKFYDFDDKKQDLFKVLSDAGVTHIRVRIWNDPFDSKGHGYGGGNVNIERAVEIGKRVTANGMKLLANFHYSDFWADPGKQKAPKAWEGKSLEEKETLLYNYTYESMQKFKEAGVDVGIVQVGNETNNGIAGESNAENMEKFSKLVTQGTRAVKAVYPNALTAVHFTNPEKQTYSRTAAQLRRYGCEYDIFGTSYYPYYHGTYENLQKQMKNIANTYDKKVMVLETSYPNSVEDTDFGGNQWNGSSSEPKYYPLTQSGQANNFRNLCNMMVNEIPEGRGIGVCYWEGTWISAGGATYEENQFKWEKYGSGWASSYAAEYDPDVAKYGGGGTQVDNQCFFDQYGKPLECLKVFGLMREGNVVEEFVDGVEDAAIVYKINDDFTLPETVNAIYNSDRRAPTAVTWESYCLSEKEVITEGNEQQIEFTLKHGDLVPGSILFSSEAGKEIWEWEGTVGGEVTGTVDYKTGKVSLTVSGTNDKPISMRYKYYSPVEPYATTIQAIKEMGPATYELVGKCSGMAVNCSMVLKAENFIVDGDFESGGTNTPWVVTNLSDTELSKKVNTGLYWAGIAKENVYSDGGSYSLGWWGQEEGVVKFEVSQPLEVPEDDTYKLGAVILTGQKATDPIPEANQNNYVAIEVNGEQAYKLQLVGGNYESGWIAYKLEGINLKTTDTVKVIIHVESSCLGYWGGIDALQLYR